MSLDDDIEKIAETTWSLVLGLSTERCLDAPCSRAPVSALVGIAGAWDGFLDLRCSDEHATHLTAILFGCAPAAVTSEQKADAVGELANVLGGNVKALLPQPSRLGLPRVGPAADWEPPCDGVRVVGNVQLACAGEAFRVFLVERTPSTSTGDPADKEE